MSQLQTVSIIVPAYNERENAAGIVEFYREVRRSEPGLAFELVVVDDGSVDGTADAVAELLQPEDAGCVVQLARNFGSHAAISAGLAQCCGDVALTLSADRQEPLSAVADFLATWRDGAELVWGLRSMRVSKGGREDFFARSFSKVFNAISTVPTYPVEGPSQILLTRKVIDVLVAMPEQNRNVLAMAAWTGFDQRRIYFEQLPRPHGVSKWTLPKKIKLVADSVTEFSSAPFQWVLGAGAVLSLAGFLLLVLALVLALGGNDGATAAVVGSVLTVGGLQTLVLAVLGEYLWRAGDDARRRPLYVVRDVLRP